MQSKYHNKYTILAAKGGEANFAINTVLWSALERLSKLSKQRDLNSLVDS